MNPRIELLLWATRIVGKKDAQPHELLEIRVDATLDEAQAAFHKVAKMAHPDLHRGMDPDDLDKVTSAYGRVANAYQLFRSQRLRPPGARPPTIERPPAPARPPTIERPPAPARTPTVERPPTAEKPPTADKPPTAEKPPTVARTATVERPPTAEVPRARRPSEQPGSVRLPGGGFLRASPAATPAKPATTGGIPIQPKSPTTPPPVPPDKKPAGSVPAIKPPEPDAAAEFEQAKPTTSTSMSSKAMVYYRKAEMALRQGDPRAGILNLKMAIAADPHSQFLRQALTNLEEELKKQ